MQNFMDILYKNYLKINIDNLPHLLKVADFYKFPHITSILRTFYIDASRNNYTLMHFAKTFIENGLVNDAIALAEKIATHFINAENHDEKEIFTIDQIYDALSPPVFAAVLIERFKKLQGSARKNHSAQKQQNKDQITAEDVNESIIKNLNSYILQKEPVEDWLVVRYIEDFIKMKGISTITEEDKEALARVFTYYTSDGTGLDDKSKLYMLKYDCDWFPARYAREHIKTILSKRLRVIKHFKNDMKHLKDKPSTNNWYLMSWIKNIRDAETRPDDTPAIEFIRTLGGSVRPINPVEYGFINIESTKEIIDSRKPENAFIQDPHLYFITAQQNETKPYIKFDMGNIISFRPSKIYFDSRACFKESELNRKDGKSTSAKKDTRSHVSKLNISFNNDSDIINFGDHSSTPEIMDLPPKIRNPFSAAKFEVIEADKGDLFRLTTLELFGKFE